MPPIYLDIEDLLGMVRRLDIGPVRDMGLLESAVARPQATLLGQDAYPTLALQAAALMHSIVRNHALADGNKRLGWLSCTVFLHVNGVTLDIGHDTAYDLVLDVAQDRLSLAEIVTALGLDAEPR